MQTQLKVERVEQPGGPTARLSCGTWSAVLNGTDVDALIQRLALYRAQIKPAVTPQLIRSHGYHIEMRTAWFAEANLDLDGTVMLMRHAGLGWLGFALEGARLTAMRRDLERAWQAMAKTRQAAAIAH